MNQHHLDVMRYFSDRPDDLLIVNFTRDEGAANKVGRFLGSDGDYRRPKKNVNPNKQRPNHQLEMLRAAAVELGVPEEEWRYDILCPSLIGESVSASYPHDTSTLR